MSPRTPARRSRPVADGLAARIIELRGLRVMLAADLAILYGVRPKALIQAVKRNRERFPPDFMFQLSPVEASNLKSQIVTSSWGGSRTLPYAFTEQGVAMLSSVLRSPRAIAVNIEIMRAFVRLRAMTATADQLRDRLDDLERKYDGQFRQVFDALRRLMEPSPSPPKRIGFTAAPTAGIRAHAAADVRARRPMGVTSRLGPLAEATPGPGPMGPNAGPARDPKRHPGTNSAKISPGQPKPRPPRFAPPRRDCGYLAAELMV